MCEINYRILDYVDSALKNDNDFIFKIINEISECAIDYISSELRDNDEFMIKCIQKCPTIIFCIPKQLISNIWFIMELLGFNHSDNIGEYSLSTKNQHDIETILKATSVNFEFTKMMNDKELVYALAEKYGDMILNYSGEKFKRDVVLAKKLMSLGSSLTPEVWHDDVKCNKDILEYLLSKHDEDIDYIPIELRNNKKFILNHVKRHKQLYFAILQKMRNDIEIQMAFHDYHSSIQNIRSPLDINFYFF